jgi:hypothetical protein
MKAAKPIPIESLTAAQRRVVLALIRLGKKSVKAA